MHSIFSAHFYLRNGKYESTGREAAGGRSGVSCWLPGEFEARRLDSGMQLIKNTCNVKGLRHFDPHTSHPLPLSPALTLRCAGCLLRAVGISLHTAREGEREENIYEFDHKVSGGLTSECRQAARTKD